VLAPAPDPSSAPAVLLSAPPELVTLHRNLKHLFASSAELWSGLCLGKNSAWLIVSASASGSQGPTFVYRECDHRPHRATNHVVLEEGYADLCTTLSKRRLERAAFQVEELCANGIKEAEYADKAHELQWWMSQFTLDTYALRVPLCVHLSRWGADNRDGGSSADFPPFLRSGLKVWLEAPNYYIRLSSFLEQRCSGALIPAIGEAEAPCGEPPFPRSIARLGRLAEGLAGIVEVVAGPGWSDDAWARLGRVPELAPEIGRQALTLKGLGEEAAAKPAIQEAATILGEAARIAGELFGSVRTLLAETHQEVADCGVNSFLGMAHQFEARHAACLRGGQPPLIEAGELCESRPLTCLLSMVTGAAIMDELAAALKADRPTTTRGKTLPSFSRDPDRSSRRHELDPVMAESKPEPRSRSGSADRSTRGRGMFEEVKQHAAPRHREKRSAIATGSTPSVRRHK
jgi:hypothetical protein